MNIIKAVKLAYEYKRYEGSGKGLGYPSECRYGFSESGQPDHWFCGG